jgi:poly-gamma-glutamate synthesis protein (capsule biosynthesis protein)
VSFVGVGDVVIDRPEPSSAFRHCADLFRRADVAFCNLEGPCSDLGTSTIGKLVTIRMRPAVIGTLADVGFDAVAFANNHDLDFGYPAFLDTLKRLDEAGVAHVGAGRDLDEAWRPAIIERNGVRLGLVGCAATIPWGYDATAERPGHAPIRVQTYYEPRYHIMSEQPGMPARVVNVINADDLGRLQDEVRRTKAEADAVVVSIHWGVAYIPEPAPYQAPLARAAIDAGADMILGHHSHILQGVEMYRGRPIFYGLSNFIFDYTEPRFGRETVLVSAEFGRRGLVRVAAHPFVSVPWDDPVPVSGTEAEAILQLLERLSAAMNSRFEWSGGAIEILPGDTERR